MKARIVSLFILIALGAWGFHESIRANRQIQILTELLVARESVNKDSLSQFYRIVERQKLSYSSSLRESWIILTCHSKNEQRKQKPTSPIKRDSSLEVEDTFGKDRPGGRVHEGIDIVAPKGTPVVCCVSGVILFVGRDVIGGNVVKILGDDKRIYYYAHLSQALYFDLASEVETGQVVGFVGNTGNAIFTPPHLHFEILEVLWPIPLITKSINPYQELIGESDSSAAKSLLCCKVRVS
jgi:murein DD-endopeptidase MepM/ murein hydrolase activator NlpD